jgi:hypothetical protein
LFLFFLVLIQRANVPQHPEHQLDAAPHGLQQRLGIREQ